LEEKNICPDGKSYQTLLEILNQPDELISPLGWSLCMNRVYVVVQYPTQKQKESFSYFVNADALHRGEIKQCWFYKDCIDNPCEETPKQTLEWAKAARTSNFRLILTYD
jgi:hypothetical protein